MTDGDAHRSAPDVHGAVPRARRKVARPTASDVHRAVPRARRKMARPTPGQSEVSREVGIRAGELLLETLEKRRDQLTMKSTVCAAAASALIFGAVQFLLNSLTRPTLWSALPGLGVILCAGVALVESLNVIKRLPRRGRKARQSRARHILHFQSAVQLGATGTTLKLRDMNADEYLNELGMQATSLARNIAMRYRALGHAYVWLSLCVACFVIGACAAVANSYASQASPNVVRGHTSPRMLLEGTLGITVLLLASDPCRRMRSSRR